MRRRTLLRLTGVSLVAGLAGCSDDVDNDRKLTPPPTETATPASTTAAIERTVNALWAAYNDEDAEGVVETLHPDSPQDITTETIEFRGTVTVESVTVTNQSEDIATAEATVTVTDGSRTITENHAYELRRHEGSWAIWTLDTTAGEATPSATATPDSS